MRRRRHKSRADEFGYSLGMHLVGRMLEANGWRAMRPMLDEIEAFISAKLVSTGVLEGSSDGEMPHLREMHGEKGFRRMVASEILQARKRLRSPGYQELERLEAMRQQFQLNPLATSILGVLYLLHNCSGFEEILRSGGLAMHEQGLVTRMARFLSTLCGVELGEVLKELSAESPLRRLHLLEMDSFEMPGELHEYLHGVCTKPLSSLFYAPFEGPCRDFSAYGTLEPVLETAAHLLREARLDGKGMTLVVHGTAGTGKSTAVRTLARESGLVAWEVARMPRKDEKDANFRWRAMAAAAQSLDPATTMLVVDEADEIDELGPHGKAVLTDLLDASAHCWVFVGNERPFDHEALRRRSSFEIEFPRPDRTFRRRLWQEISQERGVVVSEELLEQLARDFPFAPGSIHTVCRDALRLGRSKGQPLEALLPEISRLHATGMGIHEERKDSSSPTWRQDCLNVVGGIDAPLERIRSFATRRAAKDPTLHIDRVNILLSGPPGTGKTELVKQVAKETGLELISKSAADILDKYVGGTEQNLKAIFREARNAGGILFLDEIDSILRDRTGAQRSWEVSQVNQLLQEMDSFQGIFFAATNFASSLDTAAARRFQIKLEFQSLRPDQRVSLWDTQLAPLLGQSQAPVKELSQLDGLVPGDYRVVWSQLCLEENPPSVQEVVARLEAEVRSRRGVGRRLGL